MSEALNVMDPIDNEACRATWNSDVVFASQEEIQEGFG
jgi:hypothetical protein